MKIKRFHVLSVETVTNLESNRASSIVQVSVRDNELELSPPIPNQSAGVYFFYTSYSVLEISRATPSPKRSAIPINILAKQHGNLANACVKSIDEFRVVYCGSSSNINDRVRSHFRGGNGNTCLDVMHTSISDLSKWFVTFVSANQLGIGSSEIKDLERMWKIHCGWPILCRS